MQTVQITHLVYRIGSRDDIVHRFSPKGYELLNGDFPAYIEREQPALDEKAPVLAEITGTELSAEDKAAAERAVRVHYELQLSEVENVLRRCRLRILWFLLSFAASAALLFMADNNTGEVLTQYLYLPFWFFGYRLLIYPIFDYLPACRRARRLRNLASMKLVFTPAPMGEIPEEMSRQILQEAGSRAAQADAAGGEKDTVRSYFLEGDTVALETAVGTKAELLDPHCVSGQECISDEFASWLEQALPFVTPQRSVRLTVCGAGQDAEERKAITAGLGHYFSLRLAQAQQDVEENNRHIFWFALGLAVSSVVLFVLGRQADVAWHELMLIVLWFFGDYLIEYIVLTDKELKKERERRRKMKDMKVEFRSF